MKTKRRSSKWLSTVFAIPAIGIFPLTSCGLSQPWDFGTATNNGTEIKYCLLIGQNDHTDSIERTRYTRKALDTYDEEATQRVKDNANIAEPKKGSIQLTHPQTGQYVTLPVTEIEHMEQKSMAGSPWDPITANASTATWIAKHGNKITFFVSNNDGMAEGAMWAANWIKGMPMFGYDANASTLQWINTGHITGTVDQNASTQCGAAMMVIRNMLEDRDAYWENGFDPEFEGCHGFGSKNYDPMAWRGFKWSNNVKADIDQYGYVDGKLITEHSLLDDPEQQRLILSASTAIAKLGREGGSYNNIHNYMNDDGTPKEPKDLFDTFTFIKKNLSIPKQYTVCQTYCNRAEAFLMGTLKPYFDEYANRLNLGLDVITGDGNGEELIINELRNRPNKYDAFLINMSKTTSTLQYVIDLAKKAYDFEYNKKGKEKETALGKKWEWNKDPNWMGWDEWDLRLDTPLIFFNRQPHKDSGEFDKEIMHNKFFKYTYCIAADPVQGGETQGKLIQFAIQTWYEDWINKQN